MFKQNKYKKWHDNIITNAQSRVLKGYKERHHILPKSLGGSNNKSNLVELTAREHFLVHLLLCKFTVGRDRQKMAYGFHAMTSFKNKGRYTNFNSKVFESIRKNLKMTDEHKQKISKAMKGNPKIVGKKLTEEHKGKCSISLKGKTKGKKYFWIFKGEYNTLIPRDKLNEYLKKGFKKGRKASTKISINKSFLGKRYLNKDNKNLVIDNSEVDKYLNMGYKLGMCPKNYTDKWFNRNCTKSINAQEYS